LFLFPKWKDSFRLSPARSAVSVDDSLVTLTIRGPCSQSFAML
jgi:hypothetical protein